MKFSIFNSLTINLKFIQLWIRKRDIVTHKGTFLLLFKTTGLFNMLSFNSVSRKLILFWDMMKRFASSLSQCVASCMVLAEYVLMSMIEIAVTRENNGISTKVLLNNNQKIDYYYYSENYETYRNIWKLMWFDKNQTTVGCHLTFVNIRWVNFCDYLLQLGSYPYYFLCPQNKHQVFYFCHSIKNHNVTPPTYMPSLTFLFLFSCNQNILFYIFFSLILLLIPPKKVISQLDYCRSLLSVILLPLLPPLESVFHTAAVEIPFKCRLGVVLHQFKILSHPSFPPFFHLHVHIYLTYILIVFSTN